MIKSRYVSKTVDFKTLGTWNFNQDIFDTVNRLVMVSCKNNPRISGRFLVSFVQLFGK
jgi:hypothetical protein